MKFTPVRIELKPRTNAPSVAGIDAVFGVGRAVGRIESPSGIQTEAAGDVPAERGPQYAAKKDVSEETRPSGINPQAQQIETRKRDVFRPQHHRQYEISQDRRNRRDHEHEHHHRPVEA